MITDEQLIKRNNQLQVTHNALDSILKERQELLKQRDLLKIENQKLKQKIFELEESHGNTN